MCPVERLVICCRRRLFVWRLIKNIIGVKEATADLTRVKQIRDGAGADFLLLTGDDETTKDFILEGGDGVISVTANVAPKSDA